MYAFSIFIFTLVCMSYVIVEAKSSKNLRIFGNFILIILFSTLVAYRPVSVPDTDSYIDLYKQIDVFFRYPVNNFMVNEFGVEFGFVIFSQVVKCFLGESFRLFLFIIPIINISLIAFGSKKIMHHVNKEFPDFNNLRESKFGFALFLCLYTSYFGLMYNGIVLRAGFALSLTVCALAMYLDKKYIKMIVLCVIAITFHKMALIGAFVIVVFHLTPIIKRSHYFFAWLIIGGLAIFGVSNRLINLTITLSEMLINNIPILSTFSSYLINYTNYAQFGYKDIFFYVIGLILLFWRIESNIYYKLVNIYYIGLATIVLLNNVPGASRISDFMTLYMVMALYIVYRYSKEKKTSKWILMLGIACVSNVLVLSVWKLF